MWVLLAVAVIVVGFALRLNALVVVTVSGIVAGLVAGLGPVEIVEAFGSGFAGSRSVTVFIFVLPVIGLVERFGLQHQARRLIGRLARLTTGRLLASYLLIRQATAALGLLAVGGHAQAVRPIVAPMSEAAAERAHGELTQTMRERIRSYAASADNVGAFFGEDIFVAVGSILLITGFVDTTYGLKLDALDVAVWAIPSAVCAFVIHGWRMVRLDRRLTAMATADLGAGR
ncbi:membrane protein [Marmoricola endophyticus]|uniref:Membrane protein n=1 Tax=Marmoricola endophyticus TaxID=2040280 RepID=A0A917BCW8_9ACTN|nr:membrane protein [Marmoricola endophyticus]